MNGRRVAVLGLAICLGAIVVSGAAAADPGTHQVDVTDGNGNVNASYQYDAATGNVTATYDWGSEEISLGNPDESALAIQWAVNNGTSSNHTIRVGPGTYNGSVTPPYADRTIEATDGPSQTRLQQLSTEDAGFRVSSENITVRNFTVSGYNSLATDSGIWVFASNATVTGNILEDNGAGIRDVGSNSGGSTYVDNTVTNSIESGIVIQANRTTLRNNNASSNTDSGILVDGSVGTTIVGTETDDNEHGVRVTSNSNRTVVDGTVVTNNGGLTGILVEDSSDVTVRNSTLSSILSFNTAPNPVIKNNSLDTDLIELLYSDGAVVEGNTLESVSAYYAMEIFGSSDGSIRGNTINDSSNGILLGTGTENFTVRDNTVTNGSDGIIIDMFSSEWHTIANNTLESNSGHGIWVRAGNNTIAGNDALSNDQTGIYVTGGTDNTIVDNDVRHSPDGIHLDGVEGNLLESNFLSSNSNVGIRLTEANETTIRSNTATGNDEAGILLDGARNNTLERNAVVNNDPGDGIYLVNAHENDVLDNDGSGNVNGIYLSDTTNNTLDENHVRENQFGMFLGTGAENNSLNANNASRNSGVGILLQSAERNTLTDTIADDNLGGIAVYMGAVDNEIRRVTAHGNDITAYDATNVVQGTNSVTGLDVGSDGGTDVTLDVETGNVSINAFDGTAGTPNSGLNALGGLVNVTDTSSPVDADLTFHYTDADVSDLDESSIGLWNHTAGNWSEVTSASIDTSTNTVSVSLKFSDTLGLYAESTSSSGGGGGYYLPPPSDSGPEFTVTSIDLSSEEVTVGETVTVTVEIDNDGDEHGDYTGTLTADGQDVDSGTVTVNANWHETLTLSTRFDEAGTYQLAVDGQSAGTVQVTGESTFSVSDVSTSPTNVEAGGTVTITATVTNDGSTEGTTTVPLVIDGAEVDSRSVTLGPGESGTVTFERAFDEPGSVTVGGEAAGSVDIQDGSSDGADDDDGGIGLVVILLGGFGFVGVGGAGTYLLYPEKVREVQQRIQTKAGELLETYRE